MKNPCCTFIRDAARSDSMVQIPRCTFIRGCTFIRHTRVSNSRKSVSSHVLFSISIASEFSKLKLTIMIGLMTKDNLPFMFELLYIKIPSHEIPSVRSVHNPYDTRPSKRFFRSSGLYSSFLLSTLEFKDKAFFLVFNLFQTPFLKRRQKPNKVKL